MRLFWNFVSGLIFGATVGAVAALILAPGSGEETAQGDSRARSMIYLNEGRKAASKRRAELEEQLAQLRRESYVAMRIRTMPEELIINGYAIDAKLLEKKPSRAARSKRAKAAAAPMACGLIALTLKRCWRSVALIQPFMPEERRDPAPGLPKLNNDDPAFPSGEYIGTTTVDDPSHPSGTTCRFLRPEDRYCAIQVASVANGMDAWALKPLYCCAFPVVDEHVDEDDKPLAVKTPDDG